MTGEPPTVLAEDGKRGTLHRDESVAEGQVVLRFGDRRFVVPIALLKTQADGSFLLPLRVAELSEQATIPLVQERLEVEKRQRERKVSVKKLVREHEETVQVPLESSRVEVNRVEIGRPVDGPVDVRTEGDTTVIPVLMEQVVVSKQLILEAEIHVTKKRVTETFEKTLTLKEEEILIEREDEGATM